MVRDHDHHGSTLGPYRSVIYATVISDTDSSTCAHIPTRVRLQPTQHHTHAHVRLAQLGNARDVVHHVSSALGQLGHVAATAKLYPELKNSSDIRPAALPMIPSSSIPLDPVCPWATTLDRRS